MSGLYIISNVIQFKYIMDNNNIITNATVNKFKTCIYIHPLSLN